MTRAATIEQLLTHRGGVADFFGPQFSSAPKSQFAKLKIGMTMAEVNALIKAPNDMKRHETGKRWIPFYFGDDAQRVQVYYEGEGCLAYTGGNVFGGAGNQLIRITADTTKACFS